MKSSLLIKVVVLHLFAFVFVSCNDDNDNTKESQIVLETNEITGWVEQELTTKVLSDPTNLEVISENDQIASAAINGSDIIIRVKNIIGNTNIIVRNKNTKSTQKIKVYTRTIDGSWMIHEDENHKTDLDISISDDLIKTKVENDLYPYLSVKSGNVYGFSPESNIAGSGSVEIIDYNGDRTQGTYTLKYPNLVLECPNNIEEFTIEYKGLYLIKRTRDLTDFFKNKYSNDYVNSVVITQYLAYISF